MSSAPAAPPAPTARRVVACYAVLDRLMTACGFSDYTDGMYEDQPDRPYAEAQARQAEVLLDRAGCRTGKRLLDIGCGHGRILRAAQARGALATGITISPPQAREGKLSNLDVRLVDYKNLDSSWDGQFDAVIANGSLEHFAQPEDAVAGRDDAVYRHLFATAHRVLKPTAAGGFVTTAIHFRRRPDPKDWLRSPSVFPVDSADFHWSRLTHAFGGWYPAPGQLERCARGYFKLVHEEDGTGDYLLTSDAWVRGAWQTLLSPRCLVVALKGVPLVLRHPVQLVAVLRCLLGSESWNWQFRGNPSPAVLLRQTWQWCPV
jgi:cyclopropane fatty-acyl-phospholipid synthase-like methyltransferase